MTLFPDRPDKNTFAFLFLVAWSQPIRLEFARLRKCFPIYSYIVNRLWSFIKRQYLPPGTGYQGDFFCVLFLLYGGLFPNHTTDTVCCKFTKGSNSLKPIWFCNFFYSMHSTCHQLQKFCKTWCSPTWFDNLPKAACALRYKPIKSASF